MAEKTAPRKWLRRRFPLYLAATALTIFLLVTINSSDIAYILYFLVVTPVVSLCLLISMTDQKGAGILGNLAILVAYGSLSYGLFHYHNDVRDEARWCFHSKDYKAEVLSSPLPEKGELRHLEWDGWGWAGGETVEYLVFDPTGSISTAVKSNSSKEAGGIPCDVFRVRRLEHQWYSVTFYTDTSWDHCK
jgi:hypothetical protein